MPSLTKIRVFDANYYRVNVKSTQGYNGGNFGTFAAAPLIHTYNAILESTSSRLALQQKESEPITVGNKQYQVKKFLTVQPLNNSFVTDDGGDFRPTVKPHYAITPVNSSETIYNEKCKTLLMDEKGVLVQNNSLSVHAHDGLLSPAVSIEPLKKQLLAAQQQNQSKFYISYVVDDKNNQILVTQHCLLNEKSHSSLCDTLDNLKPPTLKALVKANTSIKDALVRFNKQITAEDISIKTVIAGDSPSVSPIKTSTQPLITEDGSNTTPLTAETDPTQQPPIKTNFKKQTPSDSKAHPITGTESKKQTPTTAGSKTPLNLGDNQYKNVLKDIKKLNLKTGGILGLNKSKLINKKILTKYSQMFRSEASRRQPGKNQIFLSVQNNLKKFTANAEEVIKKADLIKNSYDQEINSIKALGVLSKEQAKYLDKLKDLRSDLDKQINLLTTDIKWINESKLLDVDKTVQDLKSNKQQVLINPRSFIEILNNNELTPEKMQQILNTYKGKIVGAHTMASLHTK